MLSVIILTKNAEVTLADCISNIHPIADELIVIDSKSTDRTTEIAKINRAKVYIREMDDFASQRNFAIKHATGDWVLFLDSDEFATKRFCIEVKKTIQEFDQSSEIAGYYIHRKTYYLGKDWDFSDKVQRLLLKSKFIAWEGVVHETPKVNGTFGEIRAPVHHFTHQNLSQMLSKTIGWSDYEAQLRLEANHPKMTSIRFVRVMITGFFDSYIRGKGYKNGTEGFIEAIYQSYSMFITYAKLWEKQINHDKS
jgi:glycosyltransferase involved in cell wall biosynthesis